MDIKRQERAPIYEALEEFKKKRVVPFDVPGHKRGRGNPFNFFQIHPSRDRAKHVPG